MARSTSSNKSLWCIALGVVIFSLAPSACADSRHGNSQPADDYYLPIDGKKGRELKVALGDVIRQHTVFNYGELWYHYQVTDVVPETENQVFDYYSPVVHYFTGTGAAPDGMNKEHACPQSWWGSGAICDAYSDLFNVMPSEVNANSAKANYPIGVVGNAIYSNARMKVGPSSRSEYSGNVFEPCNEFKGDFARLYFYIATCYSNAAWGSKESVAQTVAFTQEDYPTIKPWALDLLLQWNASDPVSDWEITRNERVSAEQGNRNPFIDYPQLADYIWGDSTQFAFDLSTAIINGSGSGQGSGFSPDDGGGDNPGGGGDTPDPGDDEDSEPAAAQYGISSMLLFDSFASVAQGNDTENSGSSSQWLGDDNFPDVEAAYEAGGAIKLGSSKKAGSITSRSLQNEAGVKLLVVLKVKGWTTVEGDLLVSLSGQEAKVLSYQATMGDPYQIVTAEFHDVQANAQLTVQTSAKRAFITSVRVGIPVSQSAISPISVDGSVAPAEVNLLGQPTRATHGILVRRGQVTFR